MLLCYRHTPSLANSATPSLIFTLYLDDLILSGQHQISYYIQLVTGIIKNTHYTNRM